MVLDNTTYSHHFLTLIGNDRKKNQLKNLVTDLSVENWAGIQMSENDLAMKENPHRLLRTIGTFDFTNRSWFMFLAESHVTITRRRREAKNGNRVI